MKNTKGESNFKMRKKYCINMTQIRTANSFCEALILFLVQEKMILVMHRTLLQTNTLMV